MATAGVDIECMGSITFVSPHWRHKTATQNNLLTNNFERLVIYH